MSTSVTDILGLYVAPSLGFILANMVVFAPMRAVQDALKKGSLGDLNPLPWVFLFGNNIGWCLYSFLTQQYWVFAGNIGGVFTSIWYNKAACQLLYYEMNAEKLALAKQLENQVNAPDSADLFHDDGTPTTADTENTDHDVGDDDGFFGLAYNYANSAASPRFDYYWMAMAVFWAIVISAVGFATDTPQETKEMVVGIIVNINLVFFYAAPLSTIFKILKTRNSASLHLPSFATVTTNSFMWTAWALAIGDWYVFAPNAVGVLLGLIQFVLYLIFPRNGKGRRTSMIIQHAVGMSADEDDPHDDKDKDFDEEGDDSSHHHNNKPVAIMKPKPHKHKQPSMRDLQKQSMRNLMANMNVGGPKHRNSHGDYGDDHSTTSGMSKPAGRQRSLRNLTGGQSTRNLKQPSTRNLMPAVREEESESEESEDLYAAWPRRSRRFQLPTQVQVQQPQQAEKPATFIAKPPQQQQQQNQRKQDPPEGDLLGLTQVHQHHHQVGVPTTIPYGRPSIPQAPQSSSLWPFPPTQPQPPAASSTTLMTTLQSLLHQLQLEAASVPPVSLPVPSPTRQRVMGADAEC